MPSKRKKKSSKKKKAPSGRAKKSRKQYNKELVQAHLKTRKYMAFAPLKVVKKLGSSAALPALESIVTKKGDPMKAWWNKKGKELSVKEIKNLFAGAMKLGPPSRYK